MRRYAIAITLILLASPTLAQERRPTPPEIIDALNLKVGMQAQQLDQLYLAIARQNTATAKDRAAAEVADASAKWVLDNWVPKQP